MKPAVGLLSLVAYATGFTTLAVEFPLEFKSIEPAQIKNFPGGFGAYGQLRLRTPDALKKQPKAKSKFPLFAEFDGNGATQPRLLGRVDESTGDGKGYDELLLDLNRNGDLTDETAISLPNVETSSGEMLEFGPVKIPGSTVCGGTLSFYGSVYLANTEILRSMKTTANRDNFFAGQVMLRAGWFVQAKVTLDGSSHLIGVYDANFNGRLGELPKAYTSRRDDQESWYFNPGDSFLIDVDRSGRFTTDPFGSEICAFAPLLYLGPSPMQVKLAPDSKSLSLLPWEDKLAEVTLGSKPEQVHIISLAWKRATDDWQLIRPAIVDGRIKVPPGEYRLYNCSLLEQASPGNGVMISGYQYIPKEPVRFEADKPNLLKCGGPLDVRVTATKRKPEAWEPAARTSRASDSDFVLAINANVTGAGGETYSNFGAGAKFETRPAKPTFKVTGAGGKELVSGDLEYG